MIFGAVILSVVGIACLVIGYLVGVKERISLLHDYHYDRLSEGNKRSFCTLIGFGMLSIGIGLLLTAAVLIFTDSLLSFIATVFGGGVGLGLMVYAERKYNSGNSYHKTN